MSTTNLILCSGCARVPQDSPTGMAGWHFGTRAHHRPYAICPTCAPRQIRVTTEQRINGKWEAKTHRFDHFVDAMPLLGETTPTWVLNSDPDATIYHTTDIMFTDPESWHNDYGYIWSGTGTMTPEPKYPVIDEPPIPSACTTCGEPLPIEIGAFQNHVIVEPGWEIRWPNTSKPVTVQCPACAGWEVIDGHLMKVAP